MSEYFTKFLNGSRNFYELIKRRNTAFVLLALIADRSKKVPSDKFNDLEVGQCFIGDYTTYGVTRQQFRSDIELLKKHHFITIRTTKRGTIARIVDTSIFDISRDMANQQSNQEPTISQPTGNHQPTTKQEVRSKKEEIKEKKVQKKKSSVSPETAQDTASDELLKGWLEHFNSVFGTKYKGEDSLKTNFQYWIDQYGISDMNEAVRKAKYHKFWKDKITPTILLRQKDQKGETCDRIGEMLNQKEVYKRPDALLEISQQLYGSGNTNE